MKKKKKCWCFLYLPFNKNTWFGDTIYSPHTHVQLYLIRFSTCHFTAKTLETAHQISQRTMLYIHIEYICTLYTIYIYNTHTKTWKKPPQEWHGILPSSIWRTMAPFYANGLISLMIYCILTLCVKIKHFQQMHALIRILLISF